MSDMTAWLSLAIITNVYLVILISAAGTKAAVLRVLSAAVGMVK